MKQFLIGYACGFITVPVIVCALYAVWVLTWGQGFNFFRKHK